MSPALIHRTFKFSLLIAVFALFFFVTPRLVTAQSASAVTGWAWSSFIGWISFDGPGYGVSENLTTGALSGYAWSSNIGWISFNASDGEHPASEINLGDGKISGWIRACAAFADKNACSGALDTRTGGWDGWISLAGTAADGSAYGVTQDTSTGVWSGFAWGSGTVGAISMGGTIPVSGLSYGVFGGGCSGAACAQTVTPIATLYASPAEISSGRSTKLVWSSSNATSCTGTGFNTNEDISGNVQTQVFDIPGTYSYQVVCTGEGGVKSAPALTSVTVLPNYNVSITANPTRVKIGTTSSITWSAFGVDSCLVTGPAGTLASGASDTSKNFTTNSPYTAIINQQSKFTITCQTSTTPVTGSVTVNLLPIFNEF